MKLFTYIEFINFELPTQLFELNCSIYIYIFINIYIFIYIYIYIESFEKSHCGADQDQNYAELGTMYCNDHGGQM